MSICLALVETECLLVRLFSSSLKKSGHIAATTTRTLYRLNNEEYYSGSKSKSSSTNTYIPCRRNYEMFSRDATTFEGSGLSRCIEYQKAIDDLNSLQSRNKTIALAKYDNPKEILPLFTQQLELAGIQVDDLDSINPIHISGTKGKGSTCTFIESIMRHAGLKTGFYNSPHLIRVNERIQIAGKPIDELKFAEYFRQVYDRLERETTRHNISMPSYFSFLTILAFHIFIKEKVDCAIVEVGIGGEYDPTNVLKKPVACGIGTLDFDHTNILGNSIESIARAKTGIIKPYVPVFTVEQDYPEVYKVIKFRADELRSPMYICKPFSNDAKLRLGISGSAQYLNGALASQIAHYALKSLGYYVSQPYDESSTLGAVTTLETNLDRMPQFFKTGLENCSWPGRCQLIRYQRANFYLDGAHTRKSMENCLDWFKQASLCEVPTGTKFRNILMVNIIGDRDRHDILQPLSLYQSFEIVIFSSNRIVNSTTDTLDVAQDSKDQKIPEALRANVMVWKKLMDQSSRLNHPVVKIVPSASEAVQMVAEIIQKSSKPYEIRHNILVTGSLHFVGAIMQALQSYDSLFRC